MGRRDPRRGMTLIELMLMLTLMALIAAGALDRYRAHVHRSMRAEGTTYLKGVYLAQSAHEMEHRQYAGDFEQLGFEITGARALDAHSLRASHYTLSLHAFPYEGRERGNYQAVAAADLDTSDAMLDVLLIENDLTILE